MGYVNDTQMSKWIPAGMIQKSAGTWTPTLASNTVADVRTAAAATFLLFVPIVLESNGAALKGARLKSIDVFWKNATADLVGVTTVELEKQTLPANTVAVTGAAVTVTVDADNDTTAKRLTQASHSMKVTVTTPEWVPAGSSYTLYIAAEGAAGSVFTLYGARVNYDLRV